MNIAYIVPALANKGPVVVVQELVRQMTAHGHVCTVFYFDDITELRFDCPTVRIGARERVALERFDVVHSHGMRPDRYVNRYARKGGTTRYFSTLHNYLIRDFTYEYNFGVALVFGNRWLLCWMRRFDKIITLSRDAVRYYRRWFPARRLTYAYNTRRDEPPGELSPEEREEILAFKGEDRLIGMNTLLTRRKGADQVIRALARLPGYRLFIAGDGKTRPELEALAEREGVAGRCFFAGYRPQATRYLPYYDLYALPSRSEGFPLALLEAAVCSKPSVCSELPVIRETWSPQEVAFFRLGDIPSLCEAIRRAAAAPDMGRRMHERYRRDYNPERFYERHLAIYTENAAQ